MNIQKPLYVGADLGGTKICAVVFDASLRPLFNTQVPSDASAGKQRALDALEGAIAQCIDWCSESNVKEHVAGIGVSTAGVVDAHVGVIVDATDAIPGWCGTRLADWVGDRFGFPVSIENDVKCALLGELSVSPDLVKARTAMLTLGTGLGGAMAEQGKIVPGAHMVAGHFGRMPIPSPWERGRILSLEQLVSGTGLANVASREVGGRNFADGRDVVKYAAAGDAQALRGLDRFCEFLVMALEQLYWGLDPDVVLVGGGLSEAREHWWLRMIEKLDQRGLPLEVRPAKLHNDAGVYGAGALIKTKLVSGVVANADQ
ncbi:ROK family protein [Microbulbifer elongatus]|uniref:ROK family protein n=1 Tax=Microbulbifer elongatus TaxID=86173 RepID=UPI001CFDFA67|nr:ROK family protein [Microbulbifer elongatus]